MQSHGDITGAGGNTTQVQPAPSQCLGRPFQGRGLQAGQGLLVLPGEQPQGQLPDRLPPQKRTEATLAWDCRADSMQVPPRLCGVLPLRPPSLTTPPPGPSASPQKSWPLCALSSPSCHVDIIALALGSPSGTQRSRPRSPSHSQGRLRVGPSHTVSH